MPVCKPRFWFSISVYVKRTCFFPTRCPNYWAWPPNTEFEVYILS
jgi:hypothetical protein